MTVARLFIGLAQQIRQWDRYSQASLAFAVILLLITLLVALAGPENLQQPATISVIGLVIAIQVIVLWGNRGMVTPFTQAQRHFINGNFEEARNILEDLRQDGAEDVQAMTLLGNTYRQLGRLDESEAILYEAHNKYPDHYFPWYGFGRTLLVKGQYDGAANAIEQSLTLGAKPIVHFDLGEAYYRLGDHTNAQVHLEAAQNQPGLEPYRALMVAYLLGKIGENTSSQPLEAFIDDGLPYWKAQKDRFVHTPYGKALAEDINAIEHLTPKG